MKSFSSSSPLQGIAENDVQVLGMHHDAFSAAGVLGLQKILFCLLFHFISSLVTPIIGFLGDFEKLQFRASAHEIDHIFAVSLVDLYDPSKQSIDAHSSERYKTKLKIFSGGLFPIWGLTGAELHNSYCYVFLKLCSMQHTCWKMHYQRSLQRMPV